MIPPQKHKFLLLDAMRGIAAILVIGLHLPNTINGRWMASGSTLCVDLFFCLSGFVIAFAYEKRLQAGMSFRTFALARAIRLYPLYLVGLTIGIAFKLTALGLTVSGKENIYSGSGNLRDLVVAIIPALFFLPNLFVSRIANGPFSLDPPSWSLFYELLANFAFAWMFRRRIASTGWISLIVVASAAVLVVQLFLYGGRFDAGAAPSAFAIGIARVGFSFFMGVLLCRAFRAGFRCRIPAASFHPVVALLVLAATVMILMARIPKPLQNFYDLIAIAILIPAVVFVASSCDLSVRVKPLAVILGELSYPLYVIHMPCFYFAGGAVRALHSYGSGPMTAPVLAVILIALSVWLARVYDVPLRERLSASLSTSSSAKQPGMVPSEV